MDVPKQVEHWRQGSIEAMDVAEILMEKQKFSYALFFAHLALEKILKAHVASVTEKIPPKIHNLTRLAGIAGIVLSPERVDFLDGF